MTSVGALVTDGNATGTGVGAAVGGVVGVGVGVEFPSHPTISRMSVNQIKVLRRLNGLCMDASRCAREYKRRSAAKAATTRRHYAPRVRTSLWTDRKIQPQDITIRLDKVGTSVILVAGDDASA